MTVVTRKHEDNEVDIDEEQKLYATETLAKACLNKYMTILLLFFLQ